MQPLLLQGLNVCHSGTSGAPHSKWQPASNSTISMAAVLGSYLAVCSGSAVQMLDLNPQFGQVNIVQVFDFLQQVSAVGLFQTGKGPEEVSLPVQHKPCLLKLRGQCSVVNEKPDFMSNPTALHRCPASSSQRGSLAHAEGRTESLHQIDLQVPVCFSMPPAHRLAAGSMLAQFAAGCLQAGATWLAVGQWVSNTVELRRLSADGRSQTLHLGDRQPRALLAAYLAGRQHLFIGTSDGAVIFCSMTRSGGGQLQHQHLEALLDWACCRYQPGMSTALCWLNEQAGGHLRQMLASR